MEPTFERALADHTRTDVPLFTVPDGYANQGRTAGFNNEAEHLRASITRSIVAQSTTVEELETQATTVADRQ